MNAKDKVRIQANEMRYVTTDRKRNKDITEKLKMFEVKVIQ